MDAARIPFAPMRQNTPKSQCRVCSGSSFRISTCCSNTFFFT
jgi:hypothetical protein